MEKIGLNTKQRMKKLQLGIITKEVQQYILVQMEKNIHQIMALSI